MKFRSAFSMLACVAVLGGFLGPAHAAIVNLNNTDFPYDLGDLSMAPPFENIYRVTHFRFPTRNFSNVFLFSLSLPSEVAGLAAASPFSSAAFSSELTRLRLFRDAGDVGPSAGDTAIATASSGPLFVLDEVLNADSYYFRVVGTTDGTFGGRYFFSAGALPLAPVPEPSTYALMLAGLGIVVFVTRRGPHRVRPT